jgi:hypothetical protein
MISFRSSSLMNRISVNLPSIQKTPGGEEVLVQFSWKISPTAVCPVLSLAKQSAFFMVLGGVEQNTNGSEQMGLSLVGVLHCAWGQYTDTVGLGLNKYRALLTLRRGEIGG